MIHEKELNLKVELRTQEDFFQIEIVNFLQLKSIQKAEVTIDLDDRKKSKNNLNYFL